MRDFAEKFTKDYVKTFLIRILPEGTDLSPVEMVLNNGGLNSLIAGVEQAFSEKVTLEELQEVEDFFTRESTVRVMELSYGIQEDLNQVLVGMLQELIKAEDQALEGELLEAE